jgi:hypothetical protein
MSVTRLTLRLHWGQAAIQTVCNPTASESSDPLLVRPQAGLFRGSKRASRVLTGALAGQFSILRSGSDFPGWIQEESKVRGIFVKGMEKAFVPRE